MKKLFKYLTLFLLGGLLLVTLLLFKIDGNMFLSLDFVLGESIIRQPYKIQLLDNHKEKIDEHKFMFSDTSDVRAFFYPIFDFTLGGYSYRIIEDGARFILHSQENQTFKDLEMSDILVQFIPRGTTGTNKWIVPPEFIHITKNIDLNALIINFELDKIYDQEYDFKIQIPMSNNTILEVDSYQMFIKGLESEVFYYYSQIQSLKYYFGEYREYLKEKSRY